ncbi:MAG: hypothetical protein KDD40_04270 [Bdellovibrionales bacterium]|nr:hypothetical protein [Bdellovibrionales bacterium]
MGTNIANNLLMIRRFLFLHLFLVSILASAENKAVNVGPCESELHPVENRLMLLDREGVKPQDNIFAKTQTGQRNSHTSFLDKITNYFHLVQDNFSQIDPDSRALENLLAQEQLAEMSLNFQREGAFATQMLLTAGSGNDVVFPLGSQGEMTIPGFTFYFNIQVRIATNEEKWNYINDFKQKFAMALKQAIKMTQNEPLNFLLADWSDLVTEEFNESSYRVKSSFAGSRHETSSHTLVYNLNFNLGPNFNEQNWQTMKLWTYLVTEMIAKESRAYKAKVIPIAK